MPLASDEIANLIRYLALVANRGDRPLRVVSPDF
jgi:hypothetical protein